MAAADPPEEPAHTFAIPDLAAEHAVQRELAVAEREVERLAAARQSSPVAVGGRARRDRLLRQLAIVQVDLLRLRAHQTVQADDWAGQHERTLLREQERLVAAIARVNRPATSPVAHHRFETSWLRHREAQRRRDAIWLSVPSADAARAPALTQRP